MIQPHSKQIRCRLLLAYRISIHKCMYLHYAEKKILSWKQFLFTLISFWWCFLYASRVSASSSLAYPMKCRKCMDVHIRVYNSLYRFYQAIYVVVKFTTPKTHPACMWSVLSSLTSPAWHICSWCGCIFYYYKMICNLMIFLCSKTYMI